MVAIVVVVVVVVLALDGEKKVVFSFLSRVECSQSRVFRCLCHDVHLFACLRLHRLIFLPEFTATDLTYSRGPHETLILPLTTKVSRCIQTTTHPGACECSEGHELFFDELLGRFLRKLSRTLASAHHNHVVYD